MSNEKSTATSKSASAAQASVQSKDVPQRGRIDIQMVQNVLLIWLDQNIDDTKADCQNTVAQLRRVVNSIHKYTNGGECIEFLEMIDNEKACMIITDSLAQCIVPRVHDMSQVDSIFILCDNTQYHGEWTKEWPKIKGVFTEITNTCEALKNAAQQCEQDSMPISFIETSEDVSKKNLDQLEPTFMYTQILKEILLTIKFEQTHFMEFITYCRDAFAENDKELKNVKKFEQGYPDETPIWWYTCECFLYPMLNRALRQMNADMIIKLGFFINDLHRHIERLHQEQFDSHSSSTSFTVYRGQGMLKTEFEKMSKTKGGLISFNNFLSTSKKRNVSLVFTRNALTKPGMIGVLFVMKIDPIRSTTPFASITKVSYFKDKEDEVLFSMHTVFRIGEITQMDGNSRLFQVELTLTSDNDNDLHKLTQRIREETYRSEEGWFRLGSVLLKIGEYKKTQEVCGILLRKATAEGEKERIYHLLGLANCGRGEYEEAIQFYEKAVEIQQQSLPQNHPDLGESYNKIGNVYFQMGDYSKALSSHEKGLEIQQQSLPPNHPDLGMSYHSIGNVYFKMGDYSKALLSLEKALEIQQQSLPPNHPHLSGSYNSLGGVYHDMGDYPKALSSYEKALEIRQQSLPQSHPDFGSSYSNIGGVYFKMGDYSKALSSLEKSLESRQQSLPPNHPELGSFYHNIGNVYLMMGDYSKALSSYEKGLEIRQQSLPPNHPDLGMSYNNIGVVHNNMGNYSKALSSHEKGLEIQQQSLPSNHPDLGMSYTNIGGVYKNMSDYPKALLSLEKGLEIKQQSLPPNHPILEKFRENIETIKKKL